MKATDICIYVYVHIRKLSRRKLTRKTFTIWGLEEKESEKVFILLYFRGFFCYIFQVSRKGCVCVFVCGEKVNFHFRLME